MVMKEERAGMYGSRVNKFSLQLPMPSVQVVGVPGQYSR
jgi:hypothetical protein